MLSTSLSRSEGISSITTADLEAADELGYRIKLLGVAVRTDKGIEQRVHPTMVPKESAIAWVDGVTNAVAVEGDAVGGLTLVGGGGFGRLGVGHRVVPWRGAAGAEAGKYMILRELRK